MIVSETNDQREIDDLVARAVDLRGAGFSWDAAGTIAALMKVHARLGKLNDHLEVIELDLDQMRPGWAASIQEKP